MPSLRTYHLTCVSLTFSSVQFSHSVKSDSVTSWIAACPASLSYTNSLSSPKPMSIESVMPSNHLILYHLLLICPQSFPASGLFKWVSSSHQVAKVLVSASTSVFPMNTQDWSPLGWTDCTSLQSKGLSRVFSNITVQKHQFFSTQLSLQSNSHIHTWPLEKPEPWLMDLSWQSNVSAV